MWLLKTMAKANYQQNDEFVYPQLIKTTNENIYYRNNKTGDY